MAKNFFDEVGYEMTNAWTATGEEQRVAEDKALLENIKEARVRDNRLSDGTIIKNVVFFLKSGSPKSFKLSPYNEQYPAGTQIDPKSAVIGEYTNDDGELAYTMTCDEL